MAFPTELSSDQATRRARIITNHLQEAPTESALTIYRSPCLQYYPPEASNPFDFVPRDLRKIFDGHNLMERDWVFGLMTQCELFNPRKLGGRVFVSPDFNLSMDQQREITMRRIDYLRDRGVFKGFLTRKGVEAEMLKFALFDAFAIYDHSLAVKLGVHFFLWGGAIQFFGTKRHHDKWLKDTEDYVISGCFAMTELGHGSNVRGIETTTTYDSNTEEFVINTPTESAQKYWIGGAANHATHAIVLSQLCVEGKNQGVHAFIAQIRDRDGKTCPNIRVADCGHKIGLNGVDNGRIWFDNLRIPRENLLNSVADVSPDGRYLSAIKDPDQRFAAFLAPLTSGRVNIAAGSLYSAKVGLATAIRYSLTRRAFSVAPDESEVLLLDYPSHQRRLLPLLAKTCAMSFGANYLKSIYVSRTPESSKTLHIVSSAFKATFTWHNMRTLQECREACGGQGIKTENRIGQLTSEFDVQSTFEGDNNVLMQQVSKALFAEYTAARKRNKPVKGLGLEHMNKPSPELPSHFTSSILGCTQFQTNILCARERDLLIRFAAQVSEHQAQGQSKESAFILSYRLAEELGRAFSERAILQTFIEAEANVSDGSLKKVLSLLRCMYAMICIEEDATFFRYGLLTIENAAQVENEVSRLCKDLRPHALAVVDSLGIPDAFLGPIAFDWIHANSWASVHS